jgi:hypothetical protein
MYREIHKHSCSQEGYRRKYPQMRKIAITSLMATGGMTLFSYLLSKVVKKQFLEPALLNQLVFFRQKQRKEHHATGYLMHYAVGLFFTSLYRWLWKRNPSSQRNSVNLGLGFFNGIIGMMGWQLTFLMPPAPPRVDRKKYHIQLLAAHVVFGFLNGWSYRKLKQGSFNQNTPGIEEKEDADVLQYKQNM